VTDEPCIRGVGQASYGRVISEEELKRRTHPAWPYIHFKPGAPVEQARIDELLRGAIDLHVHGAPLGGWLPGRPTMVETCLEATEAGMRALVFKDHNTMTPNCAQILTDLVAREPKVVARTQVPVEVYGGIVLNDTVGGLNAKAVQICLGYGRCREVWLPSLDARHQRQAMGLEGGITVTVTPTGGEIVPELQKILDLMADYNRSRKASRSRSPCATSPTRRRWRS